jgi:hypothetical protein
LADLFAAPGIGGTWVRFWLTPTSSRPLAVVRIATALLGLLLLWSYAGDLQTWFGPKGILPVGTVSAWRSPYGLSLFDMAATPTAVWVLFAITAAVFGLLLVGLLTPIAAVAAAVLWASLLNRGPMLAGPADDCLAILLWCIAIGPAGEYFSVDRLLHERMGMAAPQPMWRARVALGLIKLHAAAITIGAVLSQLKGDAWWNGTAAWWLAARAGSRVVDLTGLFARSELLTNAITHAITGFEITFAIGIWFSATQQTVARIGLIAWPLIGILAGEPFWGLAMGVCALAIVTD